MNSVTVRVPAKVNLQLAVGPLRDDGYHDLVNVFHAVSLFDEVTAVAETGMSVRVEGESADQVPEDDDNLAIRAAVALARHAGRSYGVSLAIRKAIPVAGGMAGGSADAAAALVACNELWGLGLPLEDLTEIAADIGSDVPFALLGGTAVGTGRGERLTPLEAAGPFHWVFALADGGLSTAKVYAECDRIRAEEGLPVAEPRAAGALLAALRDGDAKALGAELTNDLQPAALRLRPSLAATLDAGRGHGALGAIVSGSGPTCAFLAASEAHAGELAGALRGAGVAREVLTAHGPVPGPAVV
ncbi:4-(cytidine 5'-diphospho)-2-C-methyl-D-erythritol kinase [Planomonospora parontospora]|uniref:4-(cytidine 5'-diphospho)-2-C-methyl-D-erythritol kinase n=1 Tax=Planomonospora parontospora TaxID=58119 RepID=UPI00167023B6|nr:4-(cytidine 5'-diphospho)-2-C-methyl-D-erythritol kinase [Planomonospora parontospora]GGL11796.1 4-diphosphocytidyl-2-C-methyl-D-erythritol kinase [Planomonospora parontospora subsp. antibiotica]GII14932.1 4-diphosphocytidyl-2-C-methyl-D-erythritol kinase [Planomonospora parontospora subsp. antibiotica]